MQMRRFTGETTAQALSAVRDALGRDAIILSNRSVNDQVEIIATAVLDEALLAASTAEAAAVNAPQESPVRPEERLAPVAPQETAKEVMSSDAVNEAPPPPTSLDEGARAEPAADAALETLETLDDAPEVNADRDDDRLERRLSRIEVSLWGLHDSDRAALLFLLMRFGLGATLATRLCERVSGPSIDTLLREALALLKSTLPTRCERALVDGGVLRVYGPDCDSRLQTLVKLATAWCGRHDSASVVMIGADAGQVGSIETLQAHARTLGVAVLRARDEQELGELLDSLVEKPLLLIDGGSAPAPSRDPAHRRRRDTRHYLVLPATLQRAAAEREVRLATEQGVHGCILTRLDRSTRLGESFGPLIEHYLPVVGWSDVDAADVALQPANASVLVATAVAMAKRLEESEDDRYLADLLHLRPPGAVQPGARGAVPVALPTAIDAFAELL